MIIEIAGIDGAGKSTLADWLARCHGFEERKVAPYDRRFLREAEEIALGLGTRALEAARAAAISRALLLEAARLPRGPVVFDRFVECARMYWAVKGFPPLPDNVLAAIPAPDSVVLLDVAPEVGWRRQARASEQEIAAELRYLAQCARYLRRRALEQGWVVVSGEQPLAALQSEVERRVLAPSIC